MDDRSVVSLSSAVRNGRQVWSLLSRQPFIQLQNFFARILMRDRVQTRDAWFEFAQKLRITVDLDQLAQELVTGLPDLLDLVPYCVLYLQDERGAFYQAAQHQAPSKDAADLLLKGDLLAQLRQARLVSLHGGESFSLLVPLTVAQGPQRGLVGVLALGPSASGQEYALYEQQLLLDLALEVGTAIQVALLGKALRISDERYRRATEAGKAGVWEWDVGTDEMYIAPNLKAMLGYEDHEIPNQRKAWLALVHPEDIQATQRAYGDYLEGRSPDFRVERRMIHQDSSVRWMSVRGLGVWDEQNKLYRMVGTDTDITDARELLDSLQRRDAILEAVNLVAERLLQTPDWRQSAHGVLETLGQAAGVDRVSLYENHYGDDGELRTSQRYEWVAPGSSPLARDPRLQGIPTTRGPYVRWAQVLSQGQPVVGHTRDLPLGEQPLLDAIGIRSLAAVPVFVGKAWWGFVNLVMCQAEHVWTNAELESLQTAANMLGTAVERQQALDALNRRQQELESLLETSRDLLSTLDLDELLSLITRRATTLLEAEESIIFRMEDDNETLTPILALGPYAEQITAESLKVGQGLTGYAVAHNQPILVNYAQTDPRAKFIPGTPPEDNEHLMAMPLTFRDRIIGAMVVNRLAERPFVPEELDLFIGLARQAAIALENARVYSQLEAHRETLELAVAERTAELRAANQDLQVLSHVKDEFITNVSHELRTPITSLKIYHRLLAQNPSKRDVYMARLERETDRLARIIEDLLQLSRLDQGDVDLDLTSVDINELATQYVTDRTPLAESRGLTLQIDTRQDIPPVQADKGLVGQVLSILLTNAFNYTPAGGQVFVSTHSGQSDGLEWVGFSVRDTGPGIPPHEQDHLFKRFWRGRAGRETGAPGTGLGLAIAREVVDRHHGRIDVQSEGVPGQGGVFTVWLPAAS